ncbi:MAG TPA: anti-virulence regulator CigR family protein, partial [Candidatus Macondimonas sp.]|nr:anti-virulence regulator CigR family protein [Candidatus Macondimonas sp.]
PPGIRRNLARGKPLPPGIARQAVPGPVLRGLPHHEGYEWLVCGTDLVLVAIAGAIMADVIFDVFD